MRYGVPRLLVCARWTALVATLAIGLATIASLRYSFRWDSAGALMVKIYATQLQITWLPNGWGGPRSFVRVNTDYEYLQALGWEWPWEGGPRRNAWRVLGWKEQYDRHHEIAFSLLIPLVLLALTTRALWRTKPWWWQEGQCSNCGYDLTGNVSGRCPECGESLSLKAGLRMPRKIMVEWIVCAGMWAIFLGWVFLWKYEFQDPPVG